ncbi:RPA12/RPB9/RPC11 RNA polymerase family protein [Haloglomus litoreum]|uniref:RPA12/RPB9/RPC11 RNA polymerase family protein n=1 Tax=Haloglomus litoreum TaxID=3034026 RepID=UPI0023E7CB23|nr:RPA12/RPB9/RPC11 RNA polymerase family protein [Haloglomus sp. DT116]
MEFCDECGSMMHTADGTWVCRSCGHEQSRDASSEAGVATSQEQQDDGTPAVVDATDGTGEAVREPCPADGCDSDRAHYEMLPKPGGSYEVRLFTCVECGHKWRES